MPTFVARTHLDAPPGVVRAWHANPGALERLTPPWERIRVERPSGALADGADAVLSVRVGPVWRRWVAEHHATQEGFRDEQAEGPFRAYVHEHRFLPDGAGGSWLEDRIRYELPLGGLGAAVAGRAVERRLRRMFRYRHAVSAQDARTMAQRSASPMTVAITGSHGLVGSALGPRLAAQGDRVVRLVRGTPQGPDERRWSPASESLDPAAFAGVDAVVHLAGESISKRWTKARRAEIMASRSHGTRLVAQAVARAEPRPRVLVCASAVGWYGDAGDREVAEDDPRGEGFLADVVEAWEAATRPAEDAGVRVVHARFGIVLSPRGGALPKMLLPMRMGAGGRIGTGRQWWSWVDLDDVVGALDHAIHEEGVHGPLLVASPHPVTNREFTRVLGRVMRRPTVFPLPAFAARAAMGEMADELLLSSCRAQPAKLLATGYRFAQPDLEGSLRHQLGLPA